MPIPGQNYIGSGDGKILEEVLQNKKIWESGCEICKWCKRGDVCIERIKKDIENIIDFTEKYWWPALEDANKNSMITPTAGAIIEDIIKTRSTYVRKLQLDYGLIGGHSVDVNGYCNMGCC